MVRGSGFGGHIPPDKFFKRSTIMELLSLACGHCGAPLEVPAGTRYVTCGYCSSKLEVHRSGGAIYTEVLEALQKRTEEIADDVEILKLQNELERLDREWQTDRESCMTRGKDGSLSEPSPIAGTIMGLVVIGIGIFWTVTAAQMSPPMALFGLVFIGVAAVGIFGNLKRSERFNEKKRQYESRRKEVLEALRNFENGRGGAERA
jgi:DNA-directed RNA polymerase subunit RPC12/RpoP